MVWAIFLSGEFFYTPFYDAFLFSWRLHPRLLFALGTTLHFPAFAPCVLGAFSLFLAFPPSLAICSGYYTSLSGICTLRSGCFALPLGIYTLACYLLWVPHFTFQHLHPELWVLCSFSWRLHPRPWIMGDPNRWSQAYSFVPSPEIPNLHNSFHLTSA